MRVEPRAASAWQSEAQPSTALAERNGRARSPIVIAQLLKSVDFERALRTRSQALTEHFAMHHLNDFPRAPLKYAPGSQASHLSTVAPPPVSAAVNDLNGREVRVGVCGLWWGAVVPKRHARRSVTRTLLKRQIREFVNHSGAAMPGGLCVVRLRAPFDRGVFSSAASRELKKAVRTELKQLMRHAFPAAAFV